MTCSLAHRRPDRGRRRPRLESLEARSLLTATPTPTSPADALIGASLTRATYGVDGSGFTVAEIDTGVNYNHSALGGGFGPGHKVIAGYDLADNSPDPNASWQHGTAVAGLIASENSDHPGVAPGADLVALRVFDRDNNGSFGKVADALQWVVDHHQEYRITAVNISISDGGNYSKDWFSGDGQLGQRINGLVGRLKALDIPVVAAAGNSFDGDQGMGFTAILPDTISVTASDASDHLAGDAQRLDSAHGGAAATDLAAPGVGVVSTVQGNDFATVDGTSFAAPQVTGAVVLLQQIYAKRFGHLPSVDDLGAWLKQGADPIRDPATGFAIGRLDIARSAALIPGGTPPATNPDPPPPSDPPPAGGSGDPGTPATPPDNPGPTDPGPTPGQPTPSDPPPQSGGSPGTGSPGTSDPGTPPQGGTPDGNPPSGSPSQNPPASDPGQPPQGGPSGGGSEAPQSDGPGSTPTTPPPSAPSTPTVTVTINGQSIGTFDPSDPASPLHELFLALGGDATIGSVQAWTGASSSFGQAFTAGTIQGMFQPPVTSPPTGPVVTIRGRARGMARGHAAARPMHRPWHAGFARRPRSV